jgi:hypothetical protein
MSRVKRQDAASTWWLRFAEERFPPIRTIPQLATRNTKRNGIPAAAYDSVPSRVSRGQFASARSPDPFTHAKTPSRKGRTPLPINHNPSPFPPFSMLHSQSGAPARGGPTFGRRSVGRDAAAPLFAAANPVFVRSSRCAKLRQRCRITISSHDFVSIRVNSWFQLRLRSSVSLGADPMGSGFEHCS